MQNLKPKKVAGPDQLKRTKRGKCTNHPYYLFRLPALSKAANYRPISRKCILCKALDHIMDSHLIEHIAKPDLLYVFQFGLRVKGHMRHSLQSTILVEDLARNVSTSKQTDLVLLFFPKSYY